MWRADSLENALMLGKIEIRRIKRQHRMRWLDDITDSMDTTLSKLQEVVKVRQAWRATVHGVAKSQTWLGDWTDPGFPDHLVKTITYWIALGCLWKSFDHICEGLFLGFLKNVLAFQDSFTFYMDFSRNFSTSAKKKKRKESHWEFGNLTGIVLNLYICLGCIRACIASVYLFRLYWHLNNIRSSNPWTREIFPFSYLFFNFLQQCFVVFIVQVLHVLSYSVVSNSFVTPWTVAHRLLSTMGFSR